MRYLIVIDVQNDFVDGSLGTAEAQAMLPNLLAKVEKFDGQLIVTQDTHPKDYLDTQEGRNLPVPHCIEGTEGWRIVPALDELARAKGARYYTKPTFGSVELASDVRAAWESGELESVELCGLCTDICVISNALLIKAMAPELPVSVDASCSAGVTPQKHEAALEVLASCQVAVS